jgi:hypothetical protein
VDNFLLIYFHNILLQKLQWNPKSFARDANNPGTKYLSVNISHIPPIEVAMILIPLKNILPSEMKQTSEINRNTRNSYKP